MQDVWNRHLSATLEQRPLERLREAQARKEQEQVHAAMEALGRTLLTQLNSKWSGRRFEQNNSKPFWEVLEALAQEGLGDQVGAALRLSGRRFTLSNSMASESLRRFPFAS
jgi:hypothetical protein